MNILDSNLDLKKCFPLMKQLRPHLTLEGFEQQVERQVHSSGYMLAALEVNNELRSLIGFRVTEYLAWGKILYIDDLVTDEANQGNGYASALLDWVFKKGASLNCHQIHLDSGYQRNDAHRLYLNKKMKIVGHHFSKGG